VSKNGFGKDVGFFLAGAMAGSIVAALTTPYSGPRIRRMIRYKVEDSQERLAEAANDLRWQYSKLYNRGSAMGTAKLASKIAGGARDWFQKMSESRRASAH
jgi:gas vesicle protein